MAQEKCMDDVSLSSSCEKNGRSGAEGLTSTNSRTRNTANTALHIVAATTAPAPTSLPPRNCVLINGHFKLQQEWLPSYANFTTALNAAVRKCS